MIYSGGPAQFLLFRSGVEPRSLTLSHVAARVAGALGRLTTVLLGIFMTMVGLAMTVTIVMLPLGVTIGLVGVAILLCGIFAPPMSTDG